MTTNNFEFKQNMAKRIDRVKVLSSYLMTVSTSPTVTAMKMMKIKYLPTLGMRY